MRLLPAMTSIHIPIAQHDEHAYKRAKRQYLKTTRGRDPNIGQDWTPFRAAEKTFKARFPPPNLNDVLDLKSTDLAPGGWRGRPEAVDVRGFDVDRGRRGYFIPSMPGM